MVASVAGHTLGQPIRCGLVRVLLILAAISIAWLASSLFEVHPNVSALYFACGVTFAVAVFFGWRCLLPSYLALILIQLAATLGQPALHIDWFGPLRQTVIYGGAGLSMRHIWLADAFRLSQPVALRFLLTAFLSSLVSALVTLGLPPFTKVPSELVPDVFFSFWGGDFAGLMVTVPIVLMVHHAINLAKRTARARLMAVFVERFGLRDALWLSSFGVVVSLFAILTPYLFHSQARIDVLVLLPVLLAGLWRGAIAGFAVAIQVCLIQVFARPLLGMPIGLTLDLQLLIAMNAAIALLAGASHDDKQHEWRRANFDALTGLANRSYFEERLRLELKRAFRKQQASTLLYLDLDGFKSVNDTYGHRAGDELLRQTAQRLAGSVRETDTVARLGGDEFAIILSETDDPVAVERLARNILGTMARPFALGGETVHMSVSIGIACSQPHTGSPTHLMHAADQAMYRAKASGKNQFAVAPTGASDASSF